MDRGKLCGFNCISTGRMQKPNFSGATPKQCLSQNRIRGSQVSVRKVQLNTLVQIPEKYALSAGRIGDNRINTNKRCIFQYTLPWCHIRRTRTQFIDSIFDLFLKCHNHQIAPNVIRELKFQPSNPNNHHYLPQLRRHHYPQKIPHPTIACA
uniref:Uncharacterized protein n=1 Tax=Romanomermis culicivorax TaxID=13658 RepID=A0A915IJP6_ROMCU